MPDVIWDALWNGEANTADPAIPAADWASEHRAHQFNGGKDATYGGDTIEMDQDYLDVNLLPPARSTPGRPRSSPTAAPSPTIVIRSRNLYTYYQTSPGGSFSGPKKLTSTAT